MTEEPLQRETLGWRADVGYVVINGPADFVQKLLDEGLQISLADHQKARN